tara:strand:- start:60 stop:911 length:852 start_codon:yes stop_codon:yes gene_type:complete
MPLATIAAVAGIGSAVFGAIGSSKSNSAQRRQIEAQNKAAKQKYEFDKKEVKRTNEYNQQGLKIDKQNYANQRAYEFASQDQDWQQRQYLQDFSYRQQQRAFNQSEKTYFNQLGINKRAVNRAYSDAQQGLNETMISQAFEKENLDLRTMENLGTAQLGQAGNNLLSALQAATAEKGRDISVLNANLLSAVDQTVRDMGDYKLQYDAANLRADSNRMLAPEMMRDIPKPLRTPERAFQDPYELKVGPEPIDGIYTGPGIWGTLAKGASGLADVNWGAFKPSTS